MGRREQSYLSGPGGGPDPPRTRPAKSTGRSRPLGETQWQKRKTRYDERASRSQSLGWRWRPRRRRRPSVCRTTGPGLTEALAGRSTRGTRTASTCVSRTSQSKTAPHSGLGFHGRWLLAVVLLFLLTPVAASSSTATADFSFSAAKLHGKVEFDSQSIYRLILPEGPGAFDWNLNASHVELNVSRQKFVEIGQPTDPSQTHGRVATGPPSFVEHRLSDVYVNSSSTNVSSGLESVLPSETTPQLITVNGRLAFTQNRTPEESSLPRKSQHVSPNALWVEQEEGSVTLGGNFSFRVWHAKIHVTNESGTQTYVSGNWTEGIGPRPPGQPHPVRWYYEQTVTINVTNAVMQLHSANRRVEYTADRLSFEGNVTAEFEDVEGSLSGEGDPERLQEAVWRLEGSVGMEIWKPLPDESLLRAHITSAPSVLGLEPAPEPEGTSRSTTVDPTDGENGRLALVTLPAFAVFGAAGLVAYRRFHPPGVEQVEWAILSQRPSKAARMARRLVRLKPTSNAVFLYGVSLLAMNQPGRLLLEVGPLAEALEPSARSGVAYTLALAAARLGDDGQRDRWNQVAASDPVLRQRMREEGLLPSTKTTDDDPAYL